MAAVAYSTADRPLLAFVERIFDRVNKRVGYDTAYEQRRHFCATRHDHGACHWCYCLCQHNNTSPHSDTSGYFSGGFPSTDFPAVTKAGVAPGFATAWLSPFDVASRVASLPGG